MLQILIDFLERIFRQQSLEQTGQDGVSRIWIAFCVRALHVLTEPKSALELHWDATKRVRTGWKPSSTRILEYAYRIPFTRDLSQLRAKRKLAIERKNAFKSTSPNPYKYPPRGMWYSALRGNQMHVVLR